MKISGIWLTSEEGLHPEAFDIKLGECVRRNPDATEPDFVCRNIPTDEDLKNLVIGERKVIIRPPDDGLHEPVGKQNFQNPNE